MVNKEIINNKEYYQCEICSFYYKTKKLAEACRDFCKKYNSCSLEITKHAVDPKENENKKGVANGKRN